MEEPHRKCNQCSRHGSCNKNPLCICHVHVLCLIYRCVSGLSLRVCIRGSITSLAIHCSPTCTPSRARPERLVVNAYRCSSSGLCSTGAALGSTGAALCSTGAALCSTGAALCSTGAALCSTGAALGSTGSLTLPPPFAATTPAPENTPGFAVAAIGGLPWFALARKAGLPRAAWPCR